jgi:hypothetical protein
MSSKTKTEIDGKSVVDRAALAVRRSIGRLVQLLGDDDLAVVYDAALALEALGARAVVGPLAAALPRATNLRHRAAIVGALFTFRKAEQAVVLRALTAAMKRERDPELAMRIRAALSAAIMPDLIPSRPSNRANQAPESGGDRADRHTTEGSCGTGESCPR